MAVRCRGICTVEGSPREAILVIASGLASYDGRRSVPYPRHSFLLRVYRCDGNTRRPSERPAKWRGRGTQHLRRGVIADMSANVTVQSRARRWAIVPYRLNDD